MALDKKIIHCPYCGSSESYSYIVTQRYVQSTGFTSEEYNNPDESLGVDHHGACKCDSCGKIIKARE